MSEVLYSRPHDSELAQHPLLQCDRWSCQTNENLHWIAGAA